MTTAMHIHSFLHADSETFTHILADTTAKVCAIIDPCMDFDANSGSTSFTSTNEVLDYITQNNYDLAYILETHAHADHLSSAKYIQEKLGGKIVIGKHITKVQEAFKKLYNLDTRFKTDASQFDILMNDNDTLKLGNITITALHVPGHTPADVAYEACMYEDNNIDDKDNHKKIAIFIGDTLFAPDVGTARCDFPNGSAEDLYDAISKLLSYPDDTELYLCHDYPSKDSGRSHIPMVTVGEQKNSNKHIKDLKLHDAASKKKYVAMREARDKTLAVPHLILPSIQVNIRGGNLPPAEENGVSYLKIPLNQFKAC